MRRYIFTVTIYRQFFTLQRIIDNQRNQLFRELVRAVIIRAVRNPETMFKEGIRLTIQWFFEHEEWMKNVTSGDYQKYYEEMYK